MKKNIIMILLMLSLIIISILITDTVTSSQKNNNDFNIVTSFYPMYVATLNITDGIKGISVSNLTNKATGCLHDYALTTEEIVALSNADILVINGAGMEGFLDKLISNYPNLNIIDSSEGIKLMEVDSHEHDEHEYNSHIFGSIDNYIIQINNITKMLMKLDFENASKYSKNASNYIHKLQNLKNTMATRLADIKYNNIVIYHDSFAYLAKDLGLNVVRTIELEHGEYFSASDIAEIIQDIKLYNVKALFIEKDSNDNVANAIAKETGIKVYELNPGTYGNFAKDAYIELMEENIEILKEALN